MSYEKRSLNYFINSQRNSGSNAQTGVKNMTNSNSKSTSSLRGMNSSHSSSSLMKQSKLSKNVVNLKNGQSMISHRAKSTFFESLYSFREPQTAECWS